MYCFMFSTFKQTSFLYAPCSYYDTPGCSREDDHDNIIGVGGVTNTPSTPSSILPVDETSTLPEDGFKLYEN